MDGSQEKNVLVILQWFVPSPEMIWDLPVLTAIRSRYGMVPGANRIEIEMNLGR